MARGVRFSKAERALIRELLDGFAATQRQQLIVDEIRVKLDACEQPIARVKPKLLASAAIEIFRGVLGHNRVIPPLAGANGEWARMQRRLTELQLDAELCRLAAEQAGREWRGPIKATSIVNQAETLLHNAYQPPPPDPAVTGTMREL